LGEQEEKNKARNQKRSGALFYRLEEGKSEGKKNRQENVTERAKQ